MVRTRRIGVLTGGGDCHGLNAVIRAVTKSAILEYGMEVVGIHDGYQGLIELSAEPLTTLSVSNILAVGGTIRLRNGERRGDMLLPLSPARLDAAPLVAPDQRLLVLFYQFVFLGVG